MMHPLNRILLAARVAYVGNALVVVVAIAWAARGAPSACNLIQPPSPHASSTPRN